MDEGEQPESRRALETALDIEADYGWVKYELMPALEQLELGPAR